MRILLAVLLLWLPFPALAFCGFYVAKVDGSLYNQSSKVVFVRDRGRSIITMSSDYRGATKDFALIISTPRVLARDEIRTVKAEVVAHLDAYTAPRLVEYHDYDPCARNPEPEYSSTILAEPLTSRREAVDLAEATGWDPRKIDQNIHKSMPRIYW